MSDTFKRIETSKNKYQCGCQWEFRNDEIGKGDVLVECKFHKQATISSIRKFERERKLSLTKTK